MLEKYGVEYNSQRSEIKPKISKTKLSDDKFKLISNRDWLYDQYVTQEKTFLKISEEYGFDKGTIGKYLRIHDIPAKIGWISSQGQRDLREYINSLGVGTQLNVRNILPKGEIDIVVETHKFGIEYDGLYYHGLDFKATKEQREYHQWKVLEAEKKGYNLIRITEEEWLKKPDIVKSIIHSRLGINNKIYARHCSISYVTAKIARVFFNDNHLHGFSPAKHYLALSYEGNCVMMCSFGKPRFDRIADWELIRMASIKNTTVVGGFQKLLTAFRKDNIGSILSYADRRYSTGHSYLKAGFQFIQLTTPGYLWTDGNIVYSRYQTQKSKLKELLGTYDPSLSEADNMFLNRFKIYYDCGHMKFLLT